MSDEPSEFDDAAREQIARATGYAFQDPALLETAFTHPSYDYEHGGSRGNERLEFLGDAVIDLVVAHLLYEAHPDWTEGELTRARRALVNNKHLASYSRTLALGGFVRLGRGERRAGGAKRERLLGNLFESVVGAIYLDGGLEPVTRFLRDTFGTDVEAEGELPEHDPKTRLQEWSMAEFRVFPSYEVVGDSEVENDAERFTVEVSIEGDLFGCGKGRTKRDAEQRAAKIGLRRAESPDASAGSGGQA